MYKNQVLTEISAKKKVYKTNTEIFYEAAKQLDLAITLVAVNNKTHISRYGYYIEHGLKKCYISTKSYFPNVPRWQLALMTNKLITTAVLEQNNFSTIKSLVFINKNEISLQDLITTIHQQPYPILFKPNHGHDGIGIELCYEKSIAEHIITEYYQNNVSFLAQPFIEQNEYRIMVAGSEIMFIHRKKFPEIVGDGISTIQKLVSKAKYSNKTIVMRECTKRNLTLDSVLAPGEKLRIHITKKSDPDFYLKDNFPEALQTWVKELCQTLAVETIGIDIFTSGELRDTDKITIIELNSKPSICYISSYYKDYETPLRVAKNILRRYFNLQT
jgi:D-alanine-D-alanine ligase-like ATP-grasp enzyme